MRDALLRFFREDGVAHVTRIAPVRNAALCTGITPRFARMAGTVPATPQPHRWYPVGRSKLCLRCSKFEPGFR